MILSQTPHNPHRVHSIDVKNKLKSKKKIFLVGDEMKKICILLAAMLPLLATGCADSGRKMVNSMYAAIENEEFEDALHYGKTLILEGNEDKKISDLAELLEHYINATEALEKDDIAEAKKEYDRIDNFEGSGMTDHIEELEEDLNLELRIIDNHIKDLEKGVKDDMPAHVASAKLALEKLVLPTEQDLKVKKLLQEWEKKKEEKSTYSTTPPSTPEPTPPAGEPPANITPKQACEIARKALDLPSHAKITATQHGEYYIVNAEVDYGDFTDECGCKVAVYDGAVFDLVG